MKTLEMPPAEKVTSEPDSGIDLVEVDAIVARIGRRVEDLIPLLQEIQKKHNWLPPATLERLTKVTEITPDAITGVSTFYSQFRHHPVGKHIIQTCVGTACHVGGGSLLDETFPQPPENQAGRAYRRRCAVHL